MGLTKEDHELGRFAVSTSFLGGISVYISVCSRLWRHSLYQVKRPFEE